MKKSLRERQLPPPSEYSPKFDEIRQDMVQVSFHKYGPARKNFGEGRVHAIKSLERKLQAYKDTGNTEFLADVANYAMFEYMYPIHPNGHYKPTDDHKATRPVGVPFNQER